MRGLCLLFLTALPLATHFAFAETSLKSKPKTQISTNVEQTTREGHNFNNIVGNINIVQGISPDQYREDLNAVKNELNQRLEKIIIELKNKTSRDDQYALEYDKRALEIELMKMRNTNLDLQKSYQQKVQHLQEQINELYEQRYLFAEDVVREAQISLANDEEVTARLSGKFGDEASAMVLATLSRSDNKETAKEALPGLARLSLSQNEKAARISNAALAHVVNLYRDSIVRVTAERYGHSTFGIGIVVSQNGMVLTPGHLVQGAIKFSTNLSFKKQREYSAEKVYSDYNFGLLAISDIELPLPFIGVDNIRAEEIGQVIALLPNETSVGKILSHDKNHIVTDIESKPGFAGAPVISPQGKLIGFIQSVNSNAQTILLNATSARGLISKVQG